MIKRESDKLRRFLLKHIKHDVVACDYANEIGIKRDDFNEQLEILLGNKYSVADIAKKLSMSQQWVTKHARLLDLGEREIYYGDRERYVFHSFDLDALRDVKKAIKSGRKSSIDA